MKKMHFKQDLNNRYVFNVQIQLSEKQLQLLVELGVGETETQEMVDTYIDLSDKKSKEIISSHPSFSCGLGSDINDVLSLGFLAYNHINEGQTIKLGYEDLMFHPFRCAVPYIKSIEHESFRCEINTIYPTVPSEMSDELV